MVLRFGIIGTGSIADDCHVPAINTVQGVSLTGVLSRSTDKAQIFLGRHNNHVAKAYSVLSDFASDPNIDCVIIASPDRLHAQQANACLSAGKHVLLEKPMTTSIEDAEALLKSAQAHKRTLAIGFHLRSHAGHRVLFDKIANLNAVGSIRHIRAIWAAPQNDASNWRANNELGKWWSLAAVGSHCLDLVRWIARDMNDWQNFKSTIGRQVWNGPHDETAVISAQLASGPTVEVVSSVQFGPINHLEIYGDKGQAICEGTVGRKGAGIILLNGQPLPFKQEIPFVSQLEQFAACVQSGQEPRANAESGVRSVKDLLLACDV